MTLHYQILESKFVLKEMYLSKRWCNVQEAVYDIHCTSVILCFWGENAKNIKIY